LREGVGAWNLWRRPNPGVKVDLSREDLGGANLSKANLVGADLGGTKLVGANLIESNLAGANLVKADLTEANLTRADLIGANLVEADLSRASFSGADLTNANLAGADLRGAILISADLSEANLIEAELANSTMWGTEMADLDLSVVRGLETVRHSGPSTVGINTIYRSNAKIPYVFLRGVGVPEAFITYMKSLVANPIEFYSCFISHSTKDQEFAERLHGDLQNKDVRCWFAPHDVQGGKKLHEQIDEAIRVHEKVLLILSADSMKSEWVKTEIAKARKREVREKKQVLFPVRLVPFQAIRDWECFDADAGKDSAREIREYFIPDFSEWKEHEKYKKALAKLLRDLKAGEKGGSE
jgi:hypothetical protein